MESFVMVAYAFSITVGFPWAEVATTSMKGGGERADQVDDVINFNSTGSERRFTDDVIVTIAFGSKLAIGDDDIYRARDDDLVTSHEKRDREATSGVLENETEGVELSFGQRQSTRAFGLGLDLEPIEDTRHSYSRSESAVGENAKETSKQERTWRSISPQTESGSKWPNDTNVEHDVSVESPGFGFESQQHFTAIIPRKANRKDRDSGPKAVDETPESHTKVDNGSGREDGGFAVELNSPGKLEIADPQETENASNSTDSDFSSTPFTTVYDVKNLNEASFQRYSDIVEALEKLGILDSDGKWCYSLERIVKSPEFSSHSSPFWRVELLIEARPLTSTSASAPPEVSETNTASGVECYVNGTLGRSEMSAGRNDCIPITGEDLDNETANETYIHNVSGSILRVQSSPEHHGENGALRPSKTQILVISTCSTVIGLFFIVALIMRIRNHVKRTRSLNKHRNGVRHHRAPVTSGPRDQSTASALPPSNQPPDVDAIQKENVVEKKNGPTPRPSGRFFRHRWGSGQRRSSATYPKMPILRRQSELARLFISQRSQREAAKEYIRQLSLTCPSNALFIGEILSDDRDKSPSSPSKNPFYRPSEHFQKLDIA